MPGGLIMDTNCINYTETALDWYWTHSMDLVAFPFNAEIYCKISCDTVLESADKNDLTKTHSPFCAILLRHKRRWRDTKLQFSDCARIRMFCCLDSRTRYLFRPSKKHIFYTRYIRKTTTGILNGCLLCVILLPVDGDYLKCVRHSRLHRFDKKF